MFCSSAVFLLRFGGAVIVDGVWVMKLFEKFVFGIVLICASMSAAAAQNTSNDFQPINKIVTQASAADFVKIISDLGMEAELLPFNGVGAPAITVTTGGGARFFVSFFNCSDPENYSGCEQVLIFTGQPSAGVSFDDLNLFNAESDVSKAVNVAASRIILFGTQIFFRGGVSIDNTKLITALFLTDMQRHIDRRNVAGTSVSAMLEQGLPDKAENVLGTRNTKISEHSPFQTSDVVIEAALDAAISNTLNTTFVDQ